MKFYITTPIYYVNDTPHIGHAYTSVAADVLARWRRLNGHEVFYLTGTDEHGAKIAQAAAKAGQSPKEFCDYISGEYKKAWEKLQITNDDFIRTTDTAHESAVKYFLQKLHDSGNLYLKKYEGMYCVPCEKFLATQDLNEDLCCPDHKQKPVTRSEENYFFKLSAYRDKLIERILDDAHPDHMEICPPERKSEIIGKLKAAPLEDISISRATIEWGIPLPFDKAQTAYVWIDALLNYITALGYENNSEVFKKFWPADVHLMAKDILWFHSVIWPAMLIASGIPLPKKVFAHGFFTIDGQKMSKTLGNIIRPDELINSFGPDAARYLILSLFPFGVDGDISRAGLTERYNSDLANNLGNLANRTLDMIEKFSGKVIPQGAVLPGSVSEGILSNLSSSEQLLENLEFSRFTASLQTAIDTANRYIQNTAPWKMAKENNPELPSVLYNLAANLKIITAYILPFMPMTSQKIWEQLGETESVESTAKKFFGSAPRDKSFILPHPGAVTQKTGILFPRIK